jgi:tRNA nucleotidyltransferase/poly(A) polymerase
MSDALAPLLSPLAPVRDGPPAWVVGGGLRDALLGRPVTDLDVALEGDAAVAAARLGRAHRARRFQLSARFGAWRVHGGRLPFTVDLTPLQGPTIEADLAVRDLTVNAMALPLDGPAVPLDPHGGLEDLRARRLRLVSPEALARDPVRVVRLARLALQLDFLVDRPAAERARADAPLLAGAAGERVMDEIGRILRLDRAWRGFEELDALGALGVIVPELERCRGLEQSPYHHLDVLGHTLEVVRHAVELAHDPGPVFRSLAPRVAATMAEPLADDLTRGQALGITALLHDMAKPDTVAVQPDGRITFMGHDRLGAEQADAWCRRMRTSTRLREAVVLGVRQHLPLGFLVHREPLSLREIDRYLRRTAPREVDVALLSVADRLATRGPRTRENAIVRHLALARQVVQIHYRLVDRGPVPRLLSGDELARMTGRPRGPWLSEVLDALREEQVVGAVVTREQAVGFVNRYLRERSGRE